jgi:osmotically-inducible protein OsmY
MTGCRVVVIGVLAGAAMALPTGGNGAVGQVAATDERIERQVGAALSGEEALRGVTATVRAQVVTLIGEVPSVWAREEAAARALEVGGVRSVVDEMTIAFVDDDALIGARVAEQVRRYARFTIFDHADIGVNRGVVTLFGQVTESVKATELARRASRVPGVREVRSRIETLPASTGDDALRAELAERIYRHPFLERYGRLRQPSIHIIVERGHVTLTGAVDSPGDKQTAGSIVNGTFGVLSVRNNLFVTTR